MTKIIELYNLKKYYQIKEEKPILEINELVIKKGEFVIIMGNSGSGKSTLLNIIGMVDNFNEGEYYFKGLDVKCIDKNKKAELRNKSIGFIFQNFFLIDYLSIFQNIEIPMLYKNKLSKNERELIIKTNLLKLGIESKSSSHPHELSGGQQQRVAIARALVNNPDLILADEPTGALDSKTSLTIMEILKRINQEGSTIVMVTHDKSLRKYANRVLYITDGVIKE